MTIDNVVNDNCATDNIGSVTLIGAGGVTGYTYSIDGQLSSSGVFDSLPSGNYIATLEDTNGCVVEASLSIGLDTDFDVSYKSSAKVI